MGPASPVDIILIDETHSARVAQRATPDPDNDDVHSDEFFFFKLHSHVSISPKQPLTAKLKLLEQAETTAAEAVKCAGLELREHAARLVMHTPHEKELANAHAKLKAKVFDFEDVCLRLVDAENGWTKSRAEADSASYRRQSASKRNEKSRSDGMSQRGMK